MEITSDEIMNGLIDGIEGIYKDACTSRNRRELSIIKDFLVSWIATWFYNVGNETGFESITWKQFADRYFSQRFISQDTVRDDLIYEKLIKKGLLEHGDHHVLVITDEGRAYVESIGDNSNGALRNVLSMIPVGTR